MTHETYLGKAAVVALDRASWRAWLSTHHLEAKGCWLVLFRKSSGLASLDYDQAVEEALCFGWVDSKPNKRDAQSSYLYFAPRKAGSNWSKLNRDRIMRLEAEGLVAPAGAKVVAAARADGSWLALEKAEMGICPPEMNALLDAQADARRHWDAFSVAVKRATLEWIYAAKTDVTRQKRIEETVRLAALNQKANQYQPKLKD